MGIFEEERIGDNGQIGSGEPATEGIKKKRNSPQSSQRAQRRRIERLAAFSVDSANSMVNLF
jgi:hypothetical protein